MPSVEISISTEPSTLDLEGDESMTIRVTLTLKHTMPITFRKSNSSLFNGDLLYENGLTFINLSTGKLAKRGSMNACTFGYDEFLTAETLESYMTLYPGQEEVVEAPIKQMNSHFVALLKLSGGKLWTGGDGLESGCRYEVGISASVLARSYAEGTKEQLLQVLMPTETLEDVASPEAVSLVVERSGRFDCINHDQMVTS